MGVLCVLPARLHSTRIPKKPLTVLAGHSLIEWSWRAATAVDSFDDVWVATDSDEIADCVRRFGGIPVMTSPDCASGTDRVAEVARRDEAQKYDFVVNFQADEPFVDPTAVGLAVDAVRNGTALLSTVAAPIRSAEEWRSTAVVKVAVTEKGRALYFSRAGIPHPRDEPPRFDVGPDDRFLRHVGVYVCDRDALAEWADADPSRLEQTERLEQLRALERGIDMHVVIGPATEPGVDVPEDLERAASLLSERKTDDEEHV